jgi:hypothetical protein
VDHANIPTRPPRKVSAVAPSVCRVVKVPRPEVTMTPDSAAGSDPRMGFEPSGRPPVADGDPMVIDCDTCSVRGIGCGDCVVTVLLGGPPPGVSLNDEERRAVEVLAAAGLVPPLRLVHAVDAVQIDPP